VETKGIGTSAVIAIIVIIAIAGIGGSYFALKGGEEISGEEGDGGVPAPAEFEVSNLVFNPSEVEVGEPVVISATVKNVGDLEGTYTIGLKIDGVTEATENVTLTGGVTQTVSFTVTKDTPGTYTIGVNGLQRALRISAPATFELTNLTISPTQVELGTPVGISVTVRNKGDLRGTYTVTLRINGVTEATKDITLAGGATGMASFTVTKGEAKSYNVSIDGLTDTFTVTKPPGVEILSYSSYYTGGYFYVVGEVQNTGNQNAEFVKIVATFYDAGGSIIGTSFTYTDIDTLLPIQKSPFELSSYPDQIIVDHYSLQVQFRTTSEVPYRELQILSHSSKVEYGYYKVIGEIQNTGSQNVEFVKIVATFYGSGGTVVGTSFTYTDLDTLAPNQKSPFELSSYPRTALEMGVSYYTLQFQCRIK